MDDSLARLSHTDQWKTIITGLKQDGCCIGSGNYSKSGSNDDDDDDNVTGVHMQAAVFDLLLCVRIKIIANFHLKILLGAN